MNDNETTGDTKLPELFALRLIETGEILRVESDSEMTGFESHREIFELCMDNSFPIWTTRDRNIAELVKNGNITRRRSYVDRPSNPYYPDLIEVVSLSIIARKVI